MKNRENLFFVVVALFWFVQYVYMPFLSPFMAALGISAGIIGFVAGMYGMTQMILRIPLSIAGSRKGNHKAIIGGGLAVTIISCVLPLFSHSWMFFMIMRALAGMASSTWVSYTAYLLEGAGADAKKRMGYLMAANTGGICISQIIGTILYGHIGMNGIFILGASAGAAGLILLVFTPFRKRAELRESPEQNDSLTIQQTGSSNENLALSTSLTKLFLQAARNRHLWVCSALMSIAQWVLFSTNVSFTGVFAQEALGATSLQLGLIMFVSQAASGGTSAVFGLIGNKSLPERGILVISFGFFALYCVLTAVCTNVTLLIFNQLLCGICAAIFGVILFASAGRELPDSLQLISMGIFQSVYSIGMTAGPAITGVIFERSSGNFAFTFQILTAVSILGMAGSLAFYKNANPQRIQNRKK